ncbi:MAG: hypothetical protein AAF608_09830 [Pseudomonadota bacterium]
MAAANQAEFNDQTAVYLTAGGWDAQGRRSGGIVLPREELLRPGTILMRAYHPTHKIGQWWATPQEVLAIGDHFRMGSAAFAIGRPDGQSILHAVFAVRLDWARNEEQRRASVDIKHLSRFVVIRIEQGIKAMVGEGGDAPSDDWGHLQKAFRIMDGHGGQRRVQQIFLPNLYKYPTAFTELTPDPERDPSRLPEVEVEKAFLEAAARHAKLS